VKGKGSHSDSSSNEEKAGHLSILQIEGRVLGPDEGGYETARAGQLRTWSLREPPPLDLDRKCIFAGRVSLSPG
jgi:hypothetical protein